MYWKNIDLIAIDSLYKGEYKKALYKAQKTDDVSELVEVFKKCQTRLDNKLKSYEELLNKIQKNTN